MNFFKALFGGKEETPEEKRQADEAKNFELFKFDGVRAAKMGQWGYAVKCYQEALKIKDDLEVRDYLATALMHNNELPLALEQLGKLAAAEPENAAIFMQMARVAYLMEDYGRMMQACGKAMELDKENPDALYLYAQAHIGCGEVINAIALLTKAITLRDDFGDAYLLRGKTLLKMGDADSADEDASHLLSVFSDNEDVLLLKARIEHARGDDAAAIGYYNKVIEVNPFCTDAFKERGQIHYERGESKQAGEDMQKVLELDPGQLADVSGEYSAEGVEQKVRQAYSNINPLGL